MPKKQKTIFTIGYSTRSIKQFITMLKANSVTLLVDVRSIPKSRHQPDFNEQNLEKSLKKEGIKYVHAEDLGGLRKPKANSINTAWINKSFRGFADYMQTRKFTSAVLKLISLSKTEKVAIMCAEGNPFRCHRSLIAYSLLIRGIDVYDISGPNSLHNHKLTSFAKVYRKKITYPSY